jgi:hypothetical protein
LKGEEKMKKNVFIGIISLFIIITFFSVTIVSTIINGNTLPILSIKFIKDGSKMSLTVEHAEPINTNWADFSITNSTGSVYTTLSFGLSGTVKAGDTLDFTTLGADTYNIRYDPTNMRIGSWTFV